MKVDHELLNDRIQPDYANFTEKQGQYLSFIYYYSKINRRPPAESDMQRFFHVTPPSVHRMIIELEARGLISRTPGTARSITVLLHPDHLPRLL